MINNDCYNIIDTKIRIFADMKKHICMKKYFFLFTCEEIVQIVFFATFTTHLFLKIRIMASRRKLKREISLFCGDLMTVITIYAKNNQNADAEKKQLILHAAKATFDLHTEMMSRICHTEPGNAKYYYKKLRMDYGMKLNEILNDIEKMQQ